MKIGIVISTNDPEIVWNALKFGNTSLEAVHNVKVFLIGKGVEIDSIESNRFNIGEQIQAFKRNKGEIIASGPCLKIRGRDGNDLCPVASMTDLLNFVEESDRVLTF